MTKTGGVRKRKKQRVSADLTESTTQSEENSGTKAKKNGRKKKSKVGSGSGETGSTEAQKPEGNTKKVVSMSPAGSAESMTYSEDMSSKKEPLCLNPQRKRLEQLHESDPIAMKFSDPSAELVQPIEEVSAEDFEGEVAGIKNEQLKLLTIEKLRLTRALRRVNIDETYLKKWFENVSKRFDKYESIMDKIEEVVNEYHKKREKSMEDIVNSMRPLTAHWKTNEELLKRLQQNMKNCGLLSLSHKALFDDVVHYTVSFLRKVLFTMAWIRDILFTPTDDDRRRVENSLKSDIGGSRSAEFVRS
ncbi:unnamed protein product [Caenorhabditis bovis]|uniref:Uncharacterized protein n=1 Tax=Caenorhabditis bovis TaxID=2654633 RepID=A0A8S1E514_9PELO|nr:unnamed protein product [Caenorhabditis bovis]